MKKLFFYAGLLLCLNATAQAQLPSESAVDRMELIMEAVPNPANKADSLVRITCKLTLNDSVNVNKVSLKVGTQDGLADKFSYGFNWNEKLNKNLPAKSSFKKKGNVVWLELGDFPVQRFYYEAVVENKQAKQSKPFKRY